MKTILGLTFASLGCMCESPYLALLCVCIVLVLIVKSK